MDLTLTKRMLCQLSYLGVLSGEGTHRADYNPHLAHSTSSAS